ncbi:hypothetical protein [Okeania sp. SIO1I7]|uniref:hypothetical protein n=1 Tax=Okeania sp. SIO1I7 TaxID=2607772 RepID=UPI0013F8EFF8|nr:hypothetical protein [Okeania sp. SIO1I7]NET24403.1 hypothetical protein [Okeania sp. SIO1I7]
MFVSLTSFAKQMFQLKKVIGVISCVALMTFSVFFTVQPSALAQCNGTGYVTGGDTVYLQDQGDIYTGKSYSGVRYYYPTVTPDYPVAGKFEIQGTGGPVYDGQNIQLQTLDKDGWDPGWLHRDLLGAFADSTELYYWEDYGAKTDWRIERPSNFSEEPIKYGENVYVINRDYNEFMTPTDSGYLTTEPNVHLWTFLEYCE